MIDSLTDWLNDWFIDWLTARLIHWLIDSLTDWLTDWFIDWLTEKMIHWLIDLTIDSLTDWLIDSLTDWLNDSLTDSIIDSLTDWLNDWFPDWLTEWLIKRFYWITKNRRILQLTMSHIPAQRIRAMHHRPVQSVTLTAHTDNHSPVPKHTPCMNSEHSGHRELAPHKRRTGRHLSTAVHYSSRKSSADIIRRPKGTCGTSSPAPSLYPRNSWPPSGSVDGSFLPYPGP